MTPDYGSLGEAVCSQCNGRVLGPDQTRTVLIEEAGLSADQIRELAELFGGEHLRCPLCSGDMSPVTLKGTPIDVCLGCGATFLDAGELERLSGGRHHEQQMPLAEHPVLGKSVERRLSRAEYEEQHMVTTDDRQVWEKALPMYALEGAALWGYLVRVGVGDNALEAWGIAYGIIGLPLFFSMLVDVDLRTFFTGDRRRFGPGFGRHGAFGLLMTVAAVAVGGVISTVNALISERIPRKIAKVGSAILVGGTAVAAGILTLL
jgi:Zn-finger nucleic acid-binding protein